MYPKTVAKFEEFRKAGAEVVVLDATLLIEAGIVHLVDEIWVAIASEATVLERIRKRSGLSYEETLARIRSQFSNDQRQKLANVVIDTDCTLEELEAKVKKLWERLHTQAN